MCHLVYSESTVTDIHIMVKFKSLAVGAKIHVEGLSCSLLVSLLIYNKWELNTITLSNLEYRRMLHKTSQIILNFEGLAVYWTTNQGFTISLSHGQWDTVLSSDSFFRFTTRNFDARKVLTSLNKLWAHLEWDSTPDFEFEWLNRIVTLGVIRLQDDWDLLSRRKCLRTDWELSSGSGLAHTEVATDLVLCRESCLLLLT